MRLPKKPKVNFSKPEESGWSKLDESVEEKAQSDNRWRPGDILIGERKISGHRRKTLDGFQYRIGDQILNKVDGFICNEYADWRDK